MSNTHRPQANTTTTGQDQEPQAIPPTTANTAELPLEQLDQVSGGTPQGAIDFINAVFKAK